MAADAFGEKSAATVGLVATALGTLVALGMFPSDPSPQGALAWNATIMSVGILFVPAFRIIRRSPTMMNTENFVAFGDAGGRPVRDGDVGRGDRPALAAAALAGRRRVAAARCAYHQADHPRLLRARHDELRLRGELQSA